MKKILGTISIATLLFGGILGTLALPEKVVAQIAPPSTVPGSQFNSIGGQGGISNGTVPTAAPENKPGILENMAIKPFEWAFRWIGLSMLWITSWLVWVAGNAFDLILNVTIVNLKESIGEIKIIDTMWVAIRDLANMLFIVAILKVAFETMLELPKANWQQTIRNLILAAVFMNFSLLMTKALIDVSNVLAYGFYRQLPVITGSVLDPTASPEKQRDLSELMMHHLNVQSIYHNGTAAKTGIQKTGGSLQDVVATLSANVLGSILMMIVAFVFFAAALMFLVRFIYLIILMMTSPFFFISWIFPNFSKVGGRGGKWWTTLWDQLIWPPIFMMYIWIAFFLMSSEGFKNIGGFRSEGTFADLFFAGATTAISVMINYCIVIFLFVFALMQAKKHAGAFANTAVDWGGKLSFGAMSTVGRGTVGRAANWASKNETFRDLAAKNRVADWALKGTEGVSKGSFDMRALPFMDKVEAGAAAGVGGYKKDMETQEKYRSDRAKQFGYDEHKASKHELVVLEQKNIQKTLNRELSTVTKDLKTATLNAATNASPQNLALVQELITKEKKLKEDIGVTKEIIDIHENRIGDIKDARQTDFAKRIRKHPFATLFTGATGHDQAARKIIIEANDKDIKELKENIKKISEELDKAEQSEKRLEDQIYKIVRNGQPPVGSEDDKRLKKLNEELEGVKKKTDPGSDQKKKRGELEKEVYEMEVTNKKLSAEK